MNRHLIEAIIDDLFGVNATFEFKPLSEVPTSHCGMSKIVTRGGVFHSIPADEDEVYDAIRNSQLAGIKHIIFYVQNTTKLTVAGGAGFEWSDKVLWRTKRRLRARSSANLRIA